MKATVYVLIGALAAAALAGAAPRGISGLGLGFGGVFGDIDDALLDVEADFAVPSYVALGPNLSLGFGDATALAGGLGGRVYFLAKMNYPVQPYMNFGGGIVHLFDVNAFGWSWDADWTGGYVRFGAGTDFDIPNAPMAPYMQMGGLVAFGDGGSLGEFELRGGVRFALW